MHSDLEQKENKGYKDCHWKARSILSSHGAV